ncbi:MAG TPA: ABC transporter substrate-binding protein [Macromonas sp.]|nr:ABC transporter substrate-binding protein [Macromonas sp.]
MLQRRTWVLAAAALGLLAGGALQAQTAPAVEAPDALIQRVSNDVLTTIKNDPSIRSGDLAKISALVDARIMPNVNFTRMTSSAVGRFWRQATPEQKQQLQAEFKTLLLRTYSGALGQVKDQTLGYKPFRAEPNATEVVVRTEVRGKGDPVALDYRLEKTTGGWKIYDLNVAGVWLVDTYRGQFAQEINAKGIDGLIAALVERNRNNAADKPAAPAKAG